MFLTHLRAAGFVPQECTESSLLQSQDTPSSPEKEGIVASGCECCFSTSVPREIPCNGASPTRMMPTAVNPRDFGSSRCLQPPGRAIPSSGQKGASKSHPRLSARDRSAEEPSRDKSWLGSLFPAEGTSPSPGHGQARVSSLLARGDSSSSRGRRRPSPRECRNLRETSVRVRDGSDLGRRSRALCPVRVLLGAPEHVPRSGAAGDPQIQHPSAGIVPN